VIMKQSLKENYKRFFGNFTEHDAMGRKRGYLREGIHFSEFTEYVEKSESEIRGTMREYGWSLSKVKQLAKNGNYRDLATLTHLDPRELKDVDVKQYFGVVIDVLTQD